MIIQDQTDEIQNSMTAEEQAQLQYEDAMAAAKKGNEGELKDELDYKAEIKPDCDWILGAFEKRSKARTMELDGLTGAKEYLAGATLLQTPKAHFLAVHK